MEQHAQRTATDQEIIAAVCAGDTERFSVLVRRYNQRLYRAARAIVRSDQDAEDALQQAWLEVFRHLPKFRGDAAFSTWATRIAINTALGLARRRPLLTELGSDAARGHDPDESSQGARPDLELARAQLGIFLERCLAELPQGHREVMVLRDVLELDTAEAALCLGLSQEAVRVRLHRGRVAVAAAINAELGAHVGELYAFDGERCDRITAIVMRNVAAASPLQRT